jgi:2-desacetyl-2-hydroxyethyl bacteriochlorophyllide A dehydrogenase
VSGVGRLEIEEAELEAPEAGWALVRNRYTMISPGTELSYYRATNQRVKEPGAFPVGIGYAAVGTIQEEPPGDSGFTKGETIFHPGRHRDVGPVDLGVGLSVSVEGLADPMHGLFIRFAQIACTALRTADFQPGERVTIFGLGLIGQMAARLFEIAGADVVGIDPKLSRRRAAGTDGISVLESGGGLAGSSEVVVDATGVPSVIGRALEVCTECGQLILLGSPRGTAEVDFYRHVHVRGVCICGAHERLQRFAGRNRGGRWTRVENTRYVADLIARGRLQVEHLITHVIRPEHTAKMFADLAAGAVDSLGIVIDWR